jgi:regulator of nucleoside diphosphate kinase
MTLPSISIADTDRERLMGIATAAVGHERPDVGASMLLSEVARAVVVAREALSRDVVAMHSIVEVRDNIAKTNRLLRLVFPEEAATDSDVSVLTPLGAALVGLARGDSIDWCTATGDQRSVTVLGVYPPGERKGELLNPADRRDEDDE